MDAFKLSLDFLLWMPSAASTVRLVNAYTDMVMCHGQCTHCKQSMVEIFPHKSVKCYQYLLFFIHNFIKEDVHQAVAPRSLLPNTMPPPPSSNVFTSYLSVGYVPLVERVAQGADATIVDTPSEAVGGLVSRDMFEVYGVFLHQLLKYGSVHDTCLIDPVYFRVKYGNNNNNNNKNNPNLEEEDSHDARDVFVDAYLLYLTLVYNRDFAPNTPYVREVVHQIAHRTSDDDTTGNKPAIKALQRCLAHRDTCIFVSDHATFVPWPTPKQ